MIINPANITNPYDYFKSLMGGSSSITATFSPSLEVRPMNRPNRTYCVTGPVEICSCHALLKIKINRSNCSNNNDPLPLNQLVIPTDINIVS